MVKINVSEQGFVVFPFNKDLPYVELTDQEYIDNYNEEDLTALAAIIATKPVQNE